MLLDCGQVLEEFSTRRSSLVSVLCPLDMQLVDEVNEYLSVKGIRDWSLGLAHLKALCACYSFIHVLVFYTLLAYTWLGSRVVSMLDSSAEGPGFKSQPQCCRVTVLGKLFTPIVPLFTKQRNW